MIQYVLEIVVFQLLFLAGYDLFLKKETFFQWNRAYLLVTFILSLLLPWIKIEALKTSVPHEYIGYSQVFFQLDAVQVGGIVEKISFWDALLWYQWLCILGTTITAIWFLVKLLKIQWLKNSGRKKYFNGYTQVIIAKSSLAFSFFKNVFLGEEIPVEKQPNIVAHELVHIRQWHSLDLLFFELARIIFWFNPLVYLYQMRMSELHEFIADAHVAKTNKKEQYQLLLSEVFQTQNISFINQFFKKSLIKKRIVMLSKSKSRKVFQLKYLVLLPLVLGMLVYTSCERNQEDAVFSSSVIIDEDKIVFNVKDLENSTEEEELEKSKLFQYMETVIKNGELLIKDDLNNSMEIYYEDTKVVNLDVKKSSRITPSPFALVDEVPIFPGCENATDKRACFQESIQTHIRKNFHYPQEAQDLGIQGRVSVVFQIAEDGSIANIRKRGPHQLLEDEVERIINRLPKMQPGKQDGEAVSVPFSIPINFKLEDGKDINVKKVIAQSLQDLLKSNEVNEILPTQIGLNENIEEFIKKYNQLVVERNRLLESANASNPVIKNLDEQLNALKRSMIERLNLTE